MKDSLSIQDLILISTYLDDQLSPADKGRVETRAANDPLFRSSLEEMRYTRKLLRKLPQRRAPRNFTLSPAAVTQPRARRLQPVFGFTSAVAAIATVIIFVGSQLFSGFLSAQSKAAPMAVSAPMATTAAADSLRSSAEATVIPPLILWNGSPYGQALGMGGGGGGGFDSMGVGGGNSAGSTLKESATPEPPATPEELANANPETLILGIAPKSTQGQEIVPPAAAQPAVLPAETPRAALTTANILEIIFGSLAVISLLLALIFRRRV